MTELPEEQNPKSVDFVKVNQFLRKTEKKPGALRFSDDPRDFLGAGLEAEVKRVTVPLGRKESKSLAYKEYHSEGATANALREWVHLKEAGVPVPVTFRLIQDGERYAGILMSDLTRDWQDILLSSNQTKWHVIEHVFEKNPNVVQQLAELDLKDPQFGEQIDKQITDIASKAAAAKIEFTAGDVVTAIFKDGGVIQLLVSDMGNVRLNSKMEQSELLAHNHCLAGMASLWISEGTRIAKELVAESKKRRKHPHTRHQINKDE